MNIKYRPEIDGLRAIAVAPFNKISILGDPKEYIKKLNFHRQVKSYKNYIN